MTPITAYGKGYKISKDGDIYNKKMNKMKQHLDGKGNYLMVSLCCNGVAKKFLVHRLVAQHFIDNPDVKPEVNHIDGNKTNNAASNLEWVTSSENKLHSYHVLGNTKGAVPMKGKFGATHNRSKAIKVKLLNGDIVVFGSVSEMHRETGASKSIGSNILSKKRAMPYKIVRGDAKGVVVLDYPHFELRG